MKNGMTVRADERNVGQCDARAPSDLDRGTSKRAAEREVECGDRSSSYLSIGGSGEQLVTKPRRVRESVECDQARGRTGTFVELDYRGAHAVV